MSAKMHRLINLLCCSKSVWLTARQCSSAPQAALGLALCKTDRMVVQQCQPPGWPAQGLGLSWETVVCCTRANPEKEIRRISAFHPIKQAWVGLPILKKEKKAVDCLFQLSVSASQVLSVMLSATSAEPSGS